MWSGKLFHVAAAECLKPRDANSDIFVLKIIFVLVLIQFGDESFLFSSSSRSSNHFRSRSRFSSAVSSVQGQVYMDLIYNLSILWYNTLNTIQICLWNLKKLIFIIYSLVIEDLTVFLFMQTSDLRLISSLDFKSNSYFLQH